MSIFTERGQRRELSSGNVSSGEGGGISNICICARAIPAKLKFPCKNIQEVFAFQPYSPHVPVPLHNLPQQLRAHLKCLEAKLDASSSLGVTSMNMGGDPAMVAAESFPYLPLEGSFSERQRQEEQTNGTDQRTQGPKESFRLIQAGAYS